MIAVISFLNYQMREKNYERAIQHMENSMKIIFDEFTEEEIRVFLDTGARLTKVLNKIKEESEE